METYHLFAWQGFSFEIPSGWNLSEHTTAAGISCARFFDDFSCRLEFEWTCARRRMRIEEIRKRYDKVAASMRAAGAQAENIEDMPGSWAACLYTMPEGRRLMAAFRLAPENNFFCLLKMHFENASAREAERIVRRLAGTFRLHEQGPAPWAVYDIDFHLSADFKLAATAFQAGRKMMVFGWRGRRLYMNFFSLADLLCRDKPMEQWCADFLNGFKAVSGAKFSPGTAGEIAVEHQWWRFWGNVEPLLRACPRYRAWCRLVPDKNQVFLGVFNYRGECDLAALENSLEPSLLPTSK
ncbi:MAG: hypothetical protein WC299_06470 [Kiritimatiellia bacterium]